MTEKEKFEELKIAFDESKEIITDRIKKGESINATEARAEMHRRVFNKLFPFADMEVSSFVGGEICMVLHQKRRLQE